MHRWLRLRAYKIRVVQKLQPNDDTPDAAKHVERVYRLDILWATKGSYVEIYWDFVSYYWNLMSLPTRKSKSIQSAFIWL
jgi:hypothetical protein